MLVDPSSTCMQMISFFTNMIPPLAYLQFIILAIIFFFFLKLYPKDKLRSKSFRLFGLVQAVLLNSHLAHDKVTEILERRKGTWLVKSWLYQEDILFTGDPANCQYVMTTNFSRYLKGAQWGTRFDVFGDHGSFNSDLETWEHHRRTIRALMSHKKFYQLSLKIIPETIEKSLIPVLEHVSKEGIAVDLQDLFTRYTYDVVSIMGTGSNPNSLCIEFPDIPFTGAIDDACEAIFSRYVLPKSLWKLQRWLGIGKERKLSKGWKVIDHFFEKHSSLKREELRKAEKTATEDEASFNVLELYLTEPEMMGEPTLADERVIRDNTVGFVFAGEETTSITLSWFFWLLSKNPFAEIKIREEIRRNFPQKEVNNGKPLFDHLEYESSKLVYLHAALCETLRLFPPVPYHSRSPTEADTLPSGHNVNQNTIILISAYSMGRMKSVWGEDCLEFKPERWITEDGGIKYEPPHKFFAFSTTPRICPGKDIAFIMLKAVAATIIHNYDIQVLETPPAIPVLSISLRLKHGLMARIKGRSA